jgi:hypothetical protein
MRNFRFRIKNLYKVVAFLPLLIILAGCEQMPLAPGAKYPYENLPPSTACYALEEGVTVDFDICGVCGTTWDATDPCDLSGTYVRIRQRVKITKAKIAEGQHAHPYPPADCRASYSGSLRKIGTSAKGDVYWESENHKHELIWDFILIKIDQDENYHYFDVYADERYSTGEKEIPDFIKNCGERGGLIPVVDEGNMLPPQVFAIGGMPVADPVITTDCSGEGYNCLKATDRIEPGFSGNQTDFKPYYIQISQIEECPFEFVRPLNIPKCPGDEAVKVGELAASGGGEKKDYNVYYHADTMYLWDGSAEGEVYVYNPTDEPPPQPTGRQPTLQLKALKFISTAEWTWATPECKPVVYLYPEEETNLSIKLNPDGYLTESNPLYEDGWENLVAYPDGKIIYRGKDYESLHYEAMINKFRTPKQGWVIEKENLPEFFDKILPKLGLNRKEAEEFKDYWVNRLRFSPYFFIGLLSQEEIERIEPIDFSTKPDTFIRTRFYFEDLNAPFRVVSPVLPGPPLRTGFTVVEWGGLYKEAEN